MNSEIAYLGYEGGKHLGASGFAYSGGDGSILKNDNIHNVYFAFYSIGVGHMIIENNIIRNSGIHRRRICKGSRTGGERIISKTATVSFSANPSFLEGGRNITALSSA